MKPALKTAHEECGVWLDTVQLKGKAKQKGVTRPISKLLNPFAKGGGYSLAVALNFTQTKMEMPKTKQSSISAFFTRQPRVLSEKPTSEVPNLDPVQSSSAATSPSPSPVPSGTKRRRGSYLAKSDSESGADQEWKSENVTEPEATVWQGPGEANLSPSQNMYCQSEEEQSEEFSPPQSKKRFTDPCASPGDSQPLPQAWSQDPLLVYTQYSASESYSPNQKNSTVKNISDSETSFLNSLHSDDFIGFQTDLKGKTSTQKSVKSVHSQLEEEKENCSYLSFKSPCKHAPLSHIENHQWTEPKLASPQKHSKDQLWSQAGKDKSYISQFKWAKPSSSPLKKRTQKHQSKEEDEASLAMLFTQDSEGFRVIAHRGLQASSPLKESNVRTNFVKSRTYKSLVEEEEDEVLFTQDSQGNIVIKH